MRLWQTRAVDKSGTPPCAPFPPISMLRLSTNASLCVTQRLLKSWRGLRSYRFATLKTGGEGERRAGVCSGVSCSWELAFRSLPGAALRSALGCKTLPLQGGPRRCKASSGGKPKEERVGFCTPHAPAALLSGFCRSGRIFAALVCVGKCEVFA